MNRNTSMDYSLVDLIKRGKLKLRVEQTEDLEIKALKDSTNPFNERWRNYYKDEISNALQVNQIIPVEYDHFKTREISHVNNFIDSV